MYSKVKMLKTSLIYRQILLTTSLSGEIMCFKLLSLSLLHTLGANEVHLILLSRLSLHFMLVFIRGIILQQSIQV